MHFMSKHMDTSSFLPPITQKQTDRQMKIFILLREKKNKYKDYRAISAKHYGLICEE